LPHRGANRSAEYGKSRLRGGWTLATWIGNIRRYCGIGPIKGEIQ
jgi:hypothetical protein